MLRLTAPAFGDLSGDDASMVVSLQDDIQLNAKILPGLPVDVLVS